MDEPKRQASEPMGPAPLTVECPPMNGVAPPLFSYACRLDMLSNTLESLAMQMADASGQVVQATPYGPQQVEIGTLANELHLMVPLWTSIRLKVQSLNNIVSTIPSSHH